MKGMVFHNLTVIEEAGKDKRGEIKWRCVCDCGNETIVLGGNLRTGHIKSCGHCKTPLYIDEGNYIRCIVTNGKSFIFDKQDYPIVKNYNWTVEKLGYVRTNVKNKNVRLHRLIMRPSKGKVIDHINGDRADCRRSNMRITNNQNNIFNQRLRSTNTSGYKGVFLDKRRNTYYSSITCNGKTCHIGTFRTDQIIEAAKAYNQKAIELFGEYAFLNPV